MGIFSYFNIGTNEENRPYEYRIQLVNVMLVLSMGILSGFALLHFYLGHVAMAGFQTALSILYAFTYFDPWKILRYQHKENIVVIGTILLFWFLFVNGGIEHSGIFWVPFFPFLVFVVSGLQRGKYWVGVFVVGLIAFEVLNHFHLIHLAYAQSETIFFFIAFFFYAIIAALFEVLRVKQQQALETKNTSLQTVRDTLSETLETLEQEIEKRTYELKGSNRKLAQEVEKHKATNEALKSSEDKFYKAQKMEALGTLVGGITHDFNSILSGINANLFLLQRQIKDKPQAQKPLDDIERMVFHASNMTKQLLTYARKDEVEKTHFNLSLFMKEGMKLLKSTIPSRIKFSASLTATPLPVFGNTTQIQQVLMNLVSNARDALSKQELPEIQLTVAALAEARDQRKQHPVDGDDWVYIAVKDNGNGIAPKDMQHIFDPFFTTKATGEGTGLGLAMCYGAVESHGGMIDVESQPKQGTTFHVYLPLAKQKQGETVQHSVDQNLKGHDEVILLVDDDVDLCRAQQGVLENLGYQVKLAGNGYEAIKVFAESHIDMVIMDIMMPEMGGIKAAQHIKSMDDRAKIIFASGYDKDSSTERFLSADFAQIDSIKRLDKPFSVQQLCVAVRKALDES